jgi:hypothetical protein
LRCACKPKGSPTGVCHDFYIIFAIDFLFTLTIHTKQPLKTPVGEASALQNQHGLVVIK